MTVSKSEARRLAKSAIEMDAHVLRGILEIGPEGATINGTDVLAWLARYAGSDLILVAAPVGGEGWGNDEVKACRRCGRDYTGDGCLYCAEVRARLRGT